MRKRFVAFLLLPLFAFVTADWVKVNLDERVSIEFPSKPEIKDLGGTPMWLLEASANARCMAIITDFAGFGMDSASLATEMSKPDALEQLKSGILSQMQAASVLSEKASTSQGKRTFDLVIDMGKKDTSALNKMYSKSIIAGTKMYTISFYEKNNSPQTALREKFFNSVKVK